MPSAGTRRAVRAVARIAPSSAAASPGACRWGCARALASRVIVALTAPPARTGEGCPEAWWMAAMPATSARAVAIDRPACTTRLSTNALTSAALAGMAGTPAAAAQRVHAVHARRYVRRVFRDQAAVRSSAASAASSPCAARVMRAAACAASTPAGRDGSSRRDRRRLSASAVIRAPALAGGGGHRPSPLVVGSGCPYNISLYGVDTGADRAWRRLRNRRDVAVCPPAAPRAAPVGQPARRFRHLTGSRGVRARAKLHNS